MYVAADSSAARMTQPQLAWEANSVMFTFASCDSRMYAAKVPR